MRNLLYIIALLLITGCSLSSKNPREIDEAQQLMLTDPSSALSKLNSVDVSEICDSAIIAHWALLYSEAMVANRICAPNDTIVNIAIDYYGRHNFTDEFEKASNLKTLLLSSDRSDDLATALYLQKEKEFFLYKERTKRKLYIAVSLIVLLIAGGTVIWMRQRLKIKSLENESLMAEASGLKIQLDANRAESGKLESKLRGMLDDRFSLIDTLCQTYYETQGTKAERKAIIDKVKSEIESVRTDSLPKMERVVNDCCDNILVKVKDSFPAIKPEDYRLLVYLASGLSTRTTSLLLEESVDVIYKRKSRLKSRLKESAAIDNQDFMSIF